MALYEIPLIKTNQQFNVRLGSIIYKLRLIYRLDTWFLDISDSAGQLMLAALPMVQGVNLLEQHQHLIKGGLYVLNSNADESQSFNDLGVKIQLFWRD
ncbi:phage baseplate plug family protein [Acinetobacter sp. TSRC1-2]|uniref:phage baseplate plug family protein n=1 Tax=unclassified Acinetobacter TaxID=196816 RepID=UPI003CF64BD7